MSDETQRAMMAALPYSEWRRAMDLQILAMVAHLCEELARKARQGWRFDLIDTVARMIAALPWSDDPADTYRRTLASLGSAPEQIDAAVASVQRDEWPADSLAGRVAEMSADARSDAAMLPMVGGRARGICDGKREAFDKVLDLLGVKP